MRRAGRPTAAVVVLLVAVAGLAVIVPGLTSKAWSQTPATPTCPAGSALNPATGNCETSLICPAGGSLSGTTCTETVDCPAGLNNLVIPGGSGVTIGGPLLPGNLFCASGSTTGPTLSCPTGHILETAFVGVPQTGITCTGPPNACPTGFTPTAVLCVTAPTLLCQTGEGLSGTTCVPICEAGTSLRDIPRIGTVCVPMGGTAGPAEASGGDGGSAQGGDGGRGGDGTAPQCNQNSSDVPAEQATVDCAAGGAGGDAGNAGESDGAQGGLAFSVD